MAQAPGARVGAINLLVDLTEAHLLEEDRARLAAIVDSSDDAIVSKGLGDAGAEIIGPAATSAAALELIEANRIDAALLDANLGGGSSADIALALTRKAIPFAFVTGYDRDSLPTPFREALLVGKPFSADQLCNAVERLLQHQAGDSLAKRRRERIERAPAGFRT